MIVQSFRLRRPIDGPLFCTRGKHFAERSEFKLRTDGHPHSWCAKCKREYDTTKAALNKARKEANALFHSVPFQNS